MRLPAQIFMSGLILTGGLFVLAGCSPENESVPFSNIQWFTDRGNLAQTAETTCGAEGNAGKDCHTGLASFGSPPFAL